MSSELQTEPEEIDEVDASTAPLLDHLIELRNLLECADLIVQSALRRHESRGLHYITDFPETATEARDTVLVP